MSEALRRPRLTVDKFYDWEPPPGLEDRRWELVDGETVSMAPSGLNHGAIQSQVAMLLGLHLRTVPRHHHARLIPHLRARFNQRVPDPGVSCAPFTDAGSMADPVLLVEIISPSNEAKTCANARAYATIPSVQQVLILSSTAVRAEVLRQGDDALTIVAGIETPHLHSIGYKGCLADCYATTDLT